jgi:hypothetical protein
MCAPPPYGEEHLHRLTEQLVARVAEELNGLVVGTKDSARGVCHDERVRGGVEDGCANSSAGTGWVIGGRI